MSQSRVSGRAVHPARGHAPALCSLHHNSEKQDRLRQGRHDALHPVRGKDASFAASFTPRHTPIRPL